MPIKRDELLTNYLRAIGSHDAALFIGSGLSRSAGYVDWKGLLRESAKRLGLNIDKEHDLVAVAQYYINRTSDRAAINDLLINEFSKQHKPNQNHHLIARIPIDTIWTTNFDTLIEDSLQEAGRIVDIKRRDPDLATTNRARDTTLYKMHGDIAQTDHIVISKDDYERYAKSRPVLQNTLEGHLLSKTFLFLGFSFNDPHLEYMLGHLRSLLGQSKRQHYNIMRSIQSNEYTDQSEYEYDLRKQELKIEDLNARYSVTTHLLREYADLTSLLADLERLTRARTIFVSGSAFTPDPLSQEALDLLAEQLGEQLIARGLNLISGFGAGIGIAVATGATNAYNRDPANQISERIQFRPFPLNVPADRRAAIFTQHRERMLDRAGFLIVIAGNKPGNPVAPGVLEEAAIATKRGIPVIPLAATGSAAAHLWNEGLPAVQAGTAYDGAVSLDLYEQLRDADRAIDAAFQIIERITERWLHSANTPPQKENPRNGTSSVL